MGGHGPARSNGRGRFNLLRKHQARAQVGLHLKQRSHFRVPKIRPSVVLNNILGHEHRHKKYKVRKEPVRN